MDECRLRELGHEIQKAIKEAEQNAARRQSVSTDEAARRQTQNETAASQRADEITKTLPSRVEAAANTGQGFAVVMLLEPNDHLTPEAQRRPVNEATLDDLAGAARRVCDNIKALNARADFPRKLTLKIDLPWRLLVTF